VIIDMQKRLPLYMVFDFETFSECDIKKAGGYEYAAHPSTDLLCVAYRIGTRGTILKANTEILTPSDWHNKTIDCEFIRALLDPNVKLVAHNAYFERVIVENVLPRITNLIGANRLLKTDTKRWICTAAMARTAGLPGSLDGSSSALGLSHTKDKKGHALMLKLSRPRQPTFENMSNRNGTPDEFKRLYQYCISDVDAEVDLFLRIPPLTVKEREFWRLDQDINLRGFGVDRSLVKGALSCLKREVSTFDDEVQWITEGEINSVRQRDRLLVWAKERGAKLKNLRASTVSNFLENPNFSAKVTKDTGGDLQPNVIRLLEIRQSASKSSTAKYVAFKKRTVTDGRVRDSTMFYGAHTGRQSGTGLQPQNLFKSVIDSEDIPVAIEIVKNKDLTALSALFDNPMNTLASLLRSCIVAPSGSTLDVGDFATIEVRVLFWLAGHQKGLDAFKSGIDLYIQMAALIYNLKPEAILKAYKAGELAGMQKRQLGKQVVLGAGFGIGIGGQKFQATAKTYGMNISLSLAATSIRAYRKLHAPVVKFWDVIEGAAIKALNNPTKGYRHGFLTWRMEDDWLTCTLPIGRKLYYYQPRMEWITNKNGTFLTLTYMGQNSTTKKFERMSTWGGKLTENVVQAVSRDLLYEAMSRLQKKGHTTVLAVHDEIVTERKLPDVIDLDEGLEMRTLMSMVPEWAPGLPIKVEGWSEPRYRK
jgi:DNA polymerase